MRHILTKLGSVLPVLSFATTSTLTTSSSCSCSCRGCLPRRHHHPHILAFLSHICFILASSLYIQLSFVNRNWIFVARDQYHVPKNVLVADDDAAWHNWETSSYSSSSYITFQSDKNGNINNNYTTMMMMMMMDDDIGYDPILEGIRSKYTVQSTSLQIYASLFFVLVGIFDLLRYRDTLMNVFMICAGGAGMASGMAQSGFMESVWNCVSVHIYLLEAYNLSHRERTMVDDPTTARDGDDRRGNDIVVVNDPRRRDDHRGEEKHLFVKVGNTCFLVGCILDVSFLSFVLHTMKSFFEICVLECVERFHSSDDSFFVSVFVRIIIMGGFPPSGL